MKTIFAAVVSVVSAHENHYLRRTKASKRPKSPKQGIVSLPVAQGVHLVLSDQESSESGTGLIAATSLPAEETVESANDANIEVSSTPALAQFSVDDSILIATLPTTPKPEIVILSFQDDIIDLPIACNDASECPSEYFACLDESEGNCFFPPCGRCKNMDEVFENLVSTTSSAATSFETEPI